MTLYLVKVCKGAEIRSRYNQVQVLNELRWLQSIGKKKDFPMLMLTAFKWQKS